MYTANIYSVPVGLYLWQLANRIDEEIRFWSDPVTSVGVLRNHLYAVRIVIPSNTE